MNWYHFTANSLLPMMQQQIYEMGDYSQPIQYVIMLVFSSSRQINCVCVPYFNTFLQYMNKIYWHNDGNNEGTSLNINGSYELKLRFIYGLMWSQNGPCNEETAIRLLIRKTLCLFFIGFTEFLYKHNAPGHSGIKLTKDCTKPVDESSRGPFY